MGLENVDCLIGIACLKDDEPLVLELSGHVHPDEDLILDDKHGNWFCHMRYVLGALNLHQRGPIAFDPFSLLYVL